MNKIKYLINDFISYFFSSRLFLFFLLQITIMHFYLGNLIQFSKEVNYPVSAWILPFLFQNVYIQFIYGISSVYFFSTVPFFQYNQMYLVIRQGRKKWMGCKCKRIVLSSIALSVIEFMLSIWVLVPHIEMTSDWGKVVYSLSMTSAINDYNIKIPIPYELILNYTVGEAIILTLGVLSAVTMIIGFIMFTLSMLYSRVLSVIVGTMLAVFSIVVANLYHQFEQITYFSPFSWLNILLLDGTQGPIHPRLWQIVIIALGVCVGCGVVLFYKIKRVDFEWTKEE